MVRILVFGMTENPGGVESFLLSYYRNIDTSKIQFDFLCNTKSRVAYEDELLERGARIYHITPRRESRTKFYSELETLFKEKHSEWAAIWVNVCSLANIDYLILAKKYGIPRRIIHSHNSQNMDGFIRSVLHSINRLRVGRYATDFWACSDKAAMWFYGADFPGKVVNIKNAIDVEKFCFSPEKRAEIRKRYGIKNEIVIGNVGRLHFQKNQEFAIKVFNEYYKGNKDSYLVLVGQGEDEDKLRTQVDQYGLNENVVFAGVQSDIQGWLSAFDLFLFPSRFEGLGIAALESQANGLPVLASSGVIPDELKINQNFLFKRLDENSSQWAESLNKLIIQGRVDSSSIKSSFVAAGYDIKNQAETIENCFLGMK